MEIVSTTSTNVYPQPTGKFMKGTELMLLVQFEHTWLMYCFFSEIEICYGVLYRQHCNSNCKVIYAIKAYMHGHT